MGIAMGDNNGDLLGTDFFMVWFGFVAEKNTLLGYTGLKNPGKITWQRLPDLLGITIGETWIQHDTTNPAEISNADGRV